MTILCNYVKHKLTFTESYAALQTKAVVLRLWQIILICAFFKMVAMETLIMYLDTIFHNFYELQSIISNISRNILNISDFLSRFVS